MATEESLAAVAASATPASYQLSTSDDSVAGSDVVREILNLKRELLEIKNILKDLISPVRAGGGRRREARISDGSDASYTPQRWPARKDFNLLISQGSDKFFAKYFIIKFNGNKRKLNPFSIE